MERDELDLDSMLEEFENEWVDEEVEGEESTEVEQEADDEVEETEETPAEETETQPNPNDDDAEKRNRAFADLRRQAEENRKYADFIQRLAQDSGVTPEEILNRYQERQMQAQAEQQGVPVEFFKESRETAQRLAQLEENMRAQQFDAQVEAAKSKYGADDTTIRATIEDMFRSGVDPRTQDVDFDKWYRAANLETIIQKEVENARQKDLENKKQRQESAAIGNGTSVSPSTGNDWSDDDFNAELARLGLRL